MVESECTKHISGDVILSLGCSGDVFEAAALVLFEEYADKIIDVTRVAPPVPDASQQVVCAMDMGSGEVGEIFTAIGNHLWSGRMIALRHRRRYVAL